MAYLPLLAAAGVGAVAACINTIAGGGSFLVFAVLVEGMGLDARVANGTLRVGVLTQTLTAMIGFLRRDVHSWPTVGRLVPGTAIGALGRAYVATRLSARALRPLFGVLLCVWAVVLIARPGSFAPPEDAGPRRVGLGAALAAVLIGGYGGLVQAGVAFPLMALLTLVLRLDPVVANSVKVTLVLSYTVATLPLFSLASSIDWRIGGALALGQLFGALLGVTLQIARGASLIRWTLAVALVGSGVVMLVR